MKTRTKQNLRQNMLFIWGCISFLILAGDDTPGHPMSNLEFFGSKLIALISLWLCFHTGRKFNKKGLLPEINEED